jgi:multidrug efflux pump subunit AcrA (membrane-fusion protein)
MFAAQSPSTAPAPQPAGPQPVPPRTGRRRWLYFALLPVVAAAAWFLRSRPQPKTDTIAVRIVRATRGALQRSIRLTGGVSAKNFSNILAPMMQAPDSGRGQVLIFLAPSGEFVKEGDVVAQIDGQSVKDHLDDVEATVDQSEKDLLKLRAQQQARREALEQAVRAARATWDKAKQDVLAAPVQSAIQREQVRLSVEEAKANYEEVAGELPLLDERQAAEWKIAEMSQEYQIRHRNRHRHDLDRFTLRAPRDGQVILKTIYRNGEPGQVQLGDQLAPGQPFMRVVDLSSMQVDATISEADAELVRLGQKATVRFNAYPDLVMDGRVEAVGTLAVSGRRVSYYVRTIPVRIAIEGSDKRVIPDLTASADVVLAEQDNTLVIPREAVQETGGKTVVYVKDGENVTPREIEVGTYSNTQVSVISGLQEGEQIAIRP